MNKKKFNEESEGDSDVFICMRGKKVQLEDHFNIFHSDVWPNHVCMNVTGQQRKKSIHSFAVCLYIASDYFCDHIFFCCAWLCFFASSQMLELVFVFFISHFNRAISRLVALIYAIDTFLFHSVFSVFFFSRFLLLLLVFSLKIILYGTKSRLLFVVLSSISQFRIWIWLIFK